MQQQVASTFRVALATGLMLLRADLTITDSILVSRSAEKVGDGKTSETSFVCSDGLAVASSFFSFIIRVG